MSGKAATSDQPDHVPKDQPAPSGSQNHIWIKNIAACGVPLRTVIGDGPFEFNVDYGRLDGVSVSIDAAGERVTGIMKPVVSDSLLLQLRAGTEFHKMDTSAEEELTTIVQRICSCKARVIRLLEQEMNDWALFSRGFVAVPGALQWSETGTAWREVSGGKCIAGVSVHPAHRLDVAWQQRIQSLLDLGEQPLLAIQHLYEAHRAQSPRIQWIEATVAAELAIKEALVRIEPKLEPLLLHVPSPPLGKLYGDVLRSVAGEESPFKSQLNKGAERRNKLIHRPESADLPPQDVVDYISIVEDAIIHLIGLTRKHRHCTRTHRPPSPQQ